MIHAAIDRRHFMNSIITPLPQIGQVSKGGLDGLPEAHRISARRLTSMSSEFQSVQNPFEAEGQRRAREAGAAGYAFFAQGRFAEALLQFREAVQFAPADSDLHYNLSCAALALGDIGVARSHLLQTLQLAPDYPKAHDALARLSFEAGNVDEALEHISEAVRLNPAEAVFFLTHATVLEGCGRAVESWDAAQIAVKNDRLADQATMVCLRLASELGRISEAKALLDAVLLRPAADLTARRQLHFTAAAFFDRIGRYDEAFAQARRAHGLRRRPYDAAARAAELTRRIEHWTAARAARLPRATHGSDRPVFIIGMPRSGTSLVEQVLGCHPDVYAGGELDAMNKTAKSLDALGAPYPRSLESLTPQLADRIADVYLQIINSLNPGARRVTDKMPLNFMYLDLIQALLPESRVIHCVRDPLDTCVSCYMTEFETPYDFADDLNNLGAFYSDYRKLVEHWKKVLSLKILEVRYEDVVADLEGQTRRMLDFLGLPWDDHCLRFHESTRRVKTASRDQVRRPIYASSVGRWKHFANHLGDLRAGLDGR
jgi:tetratricopeptide (TPR) repeat protein